MRQNNFKWVILIFLFIACVLIIAAGVWLYLSGGAASLGTSGLPPTIRIASPADGALVSSGQALRLGTEVLAEGGLSRVDLFVDGQLEQQYTPQTGGLTFDTPLFIWFGIEPGWHKLSVIAYDASSRPSPEAMIRVGVVVDLVGDQSLVEIPSDVPPSEEGSADGQDSVPSADDPGAPQDSSQQDQQGGADLPDLPPPPQDAPPVIQDFRMTSSVDAAGAVSLAAFVNSTDDLGLVRLVLNWRSAAGGFGETSVLCGGGQACELQHSMNPSAGEWIFSAQAYDSSGHASDPVLRRIQVIEHEGFPPAVAEENADEGMFSDWLEDQWDIADFDFDPFLPGFDLSDLWRIFPGEAPRVEADGRCLNYVLEATQEGIRHTLTVACDLQTAQAGEILEPLVAKKLPNTHIPSIDLRIIEWRDAARTQIPSGQTFTWLDHDVTCGTQYEYRAHVERISETGNGYAYHGTAAQAEAGITTPACAPGSLGDVSLRSEPEAGGVRVLWQLNGGAIWPADLPAEGAAFELIRFDLDTQQSSVLYRESIPLQVLQAGGLYSVLDEGLQCGNRYQYMLTAIAANADFGLVSPGWLLRAYSAIPQLPCAEGSLAAVELQARPVWINDTFMAARLSMQIPPGLDLPQADRVELRILRILQGDDSCEASPCDLFWQVSEKIPVTDQIRSQGLDYSEIDHNANRPVGTYIYRLALFVDNVEIQSGVNVDVTMPKSTPPPPDIRRVTATNTCPAGVLRCVVVEWAPYASPQPDNPYYAEAAHIYVERLVGALDQRLFPVGMGDTRFVDVNPYAVEHHMADGSTRLLCSYSVIYRMVAYDADGHSYGASPIQIDTPACNDAWNVVEEAGR